MKFFKPKPGTRSAVHILKTPFPDIMAFEAIVRSLVSNPIGCTSYMCAKRNHPPRRSRAGDVYGKVRVPE